MKTLVLEIQNGGLGDHLFYSHLPRIAKETGAFDEVYISAHSVFRHADYRKLVWETNPHIDGFTDQKGIFHLPDEIGEEENLLDRIMLLYGLDDGKRFHEPEIYYRPVIKPELKDAVIYDPNFISYTGEISTGRPIEKWLQDHDETVTFQMKKINRRYLPIHCDAMLETDSLFDFCSVLVSAKKIYCLTTGTATLAAALHVPLSVFYGSGHQELYRHSKMHTYINVGSDYTFIDWAKKRVTFFLRRFIFFGPR